MNYKDLFKKTSTEELFEAVLEKHKKPIEDKVKEDKE